jgi:DNA-binding LacI/PurR family transcriptional regulator
VLGTGNQGGAELREIGRLQALHLIDLGRTGLGYALPGQRPMQWRVQERLRGVAAACAERGLAEPLALEVEMDGARAAVTVDQWVRASVTAVCAYNDETGLAVPAGMHRRGLRAPDDIAVIGVGDTAVTRVSIPALSTVGFDYEETGRELAGVIVASLDDGVRTAPGSFSHPRLIRRASSAIASAAG